MKKLLIILFLFTTAAQAQTRNYILGPIFVNAPVIPIIVDTIDIVYPSSNRQIYVSNYGSDANTGLGTVGNVVTTAIATIAKLNTLNLQPDDSVHFKGGHFFTGTISLHNSGTSGHPIVLCSYGKSGLKPVITALKTLTGWAQVGSTNVWQLTTTLRNALNVVTINGLPQEVGRYPNSDATNGGYLVATGSSGNTTMTAAELSGTNWTGAEIVARKRAYKIERDKISSQSGGTVTYSPSIASINPYTGYVATSDNTSTSTGFGLFIQRDLRTLDKQGEWFYDSTAHLLSMYLIASPSTYSIQASGYDTLININNYNYINVDNLAITGANLSAICYHDNTNISVTNCNISNTGARGVFGWYSVNNVISNNTFSYSLSTAIDKRAPANYTTIYNNTITNTAPYKGMASFFDDADAKAIYAAANGTGTVRRNSIDSCAYNGIQFDGSGMTVDSNFINHYCMNRDDGAGIYTFGNTGTGRTIKNNIVINGIGARHVGTAEDTDCQGIYTDGGASGIDILNNTIGTVGSTGFGLFLNSPKNINVRSNSVYNANGWYVGRQYNDSLFSYTFKQNVLYNTVNTQFGGYYTNSQVNSSNRTATSGIQNALQLLGAVDSNYYNNINSLPFQWYYSSDNGSTWTFPAAVSFSTWLSYTGQDAHAASVTAGTSSVFYYNATIANQTYLFTGTRTDVYGTGYTGSVTISPYSSKILMY
jgi:hypothetical protein